MGFGVTRGQRQDFTVTPVSTTTVDTGDTGIIVEELLSRHTECLGNAVCSNHVSKTTAISQIRQIQAVALSHTYLLTLHHCFVPCLRESRCYILVTPNHHAQPRIIIYTVFAYITLPLKQVHMLRDIQDAQSVS